MCRMRQDPTRIHVVATCGKENALKVWDLQGSEEPVFRAKNVSDEGGEMLCLRLGEVKATDSDHNLDGLWRGMEDWREQVRLTNTLCPIYTFHTRCGMIGLIYGFLFGTKTYSSSLGHRNLSRAQGTTR